MLNAPAKLEIIEPGKRTVEIDAPPCVHCGFIMLLRPGFGTPQTMILRADGSSYMRDAGWCRKCSAHICPRCDGGACVPREKRADLEEAAARRVFSCQ